MKIMVWLVTAGLILVSNPSVRAQEVKESLDPQVDIQTQPGFLIGADFVSR